MTLIQDTKPVVDPPVEVAEETVVIPPDQFKPHGNESMLLVNEINYCLILII